MNECNFSIKTAKTLENKIKRTKYIKYVCITHINRVSGNSNSCIIPSVNRSRRKTPSHNFIVCVCVRRLSGISKYEEILLEE